MCSKKNILVSTNPNVYLNEYINQISILPNHIQRMEDSDDDEDVIIIYETMVDCIKEIEHYLSNDILISSIFIYINIENEDCDDIYDLLISIYKNINFILE